MLVLCLLGHTVTRAGHLSVHMLQYVPKSRWFECGKVVPNLKIQSQTSGAYERM